MRAPILAGLLAAVTAQAVAQTATSVPAQSAVVSVPRMDAQPGMAPTNEHLFGDWGGLRTKLEDMGIYLSLDALTEFAGNVSGGTQQGSTFAGQEALGLDIDWQRLAGVPGFSTHLIIVNRWGGNDSNLFGDHLLPV